IDRLPERGLSVSQAPRPVCRHRDDAADDARFTHHRLDAPGGSNRRRRRPASRPGGGDHVRDRPFPHPRRRLPQPGRHRRDRTRPGPRERRAPVSGSQGLLQIDLAHETVELRAEPVHGASLLASADRARVAIYDNSLRVYTVATDTMTSASSVSSVFTVGLDGTGSTFVVNPNGQVLDGDLNLRATIPSYGRGTAL